MKRRHESSAVAGGFEAAPDETDAVAAIAPSAVALTDGDIAPFVRSLYSLVDDEHLVLTSGHRGALHTIRAAVPW